MLRERDDFAHGADTRTLDCLHGVAFAARKTSMARSAVVSRSIKLRFYPSATYRILALRAPIIASEHCIAVITIGRKLTCRG